MLFSGTFFPISQLPGLDPPARLRDAAVARRGAVPRRSALGTVDAWLGAPSHVGYLAAMAAIGLWAGRPSYRRRLYV